MVLPEQIEARIRAGIDGVERVLIEDLTGTHDHYQAVIVATAFVGLSRLQRQRLVYEVLGDWMHGPIHALTLQIFAPAEWDAAAPSGVDKPSSRP